MNFRSTRIHKIAAYISGITIVLYGLQGPMATGSLRSELLAKNSTSIYSVESEAGSLESSTVSSMASSEVSSAVSSAIRSAASSSAASSKTTSSKTAAVKPKAVVPTKKQLQAATKVVPTQAQKAAEDPEAIKAKTSVPVKNSISISSSSTVSNAASSASSSSKSSSTSSAVTSSASSSSSVVTSASSASSSAPVAYTGWKTINGIKYFYYQNNPLTGWQTIEGNKYYFDSKGALKTRLGIDVSEYQGTIDWKKVKAAGIDFAIIRAGWRGYGGGSYNKDSCFEQNYNGAKAAGISVGVYFFSQAITVEEAVAEAQFTLDILGGRSLTEPIAIDIEGISDPDARTNLANLTNQQRTDFGVAFCEKIKSAGYTPMVYSGKYYFYNKLIISQLSPYITWIAQYLYDAPNEGTTYGYPYKYWQYTSSGKIDGISSSGLDMDISF